MKTADLLFSSLITFLKQIESSNWKDLKKYTLKKSLKMLALKLGKLE